jgi:hypothetical protein
MLRYSFVFLSLVYTMFPVSLDCQFLIAPSIFSNVNLQQPSVVISQIRDFICFDLVREIVSFIFVSNIMAFFRICLTYIVSLLLLTGRRGHDRDWMIVGFTTTYAISAYHHWCCEFESRSGQGVQHYVIKFVSDLKQVGGFLRVPRFPPPIKLTATI